MNIESSVLQKITELVNDEIRKGVGEKLTKYAEYVASRYDISLPLLLDDMRNLDIIEIPKPGDGNENTSPNQCLGTKATGSRCKLKGKHNGYCRWHKEQKPRRIPSRMALCEDDIVQHNHTLPPLFKSGCPACEKSRTATHQNLLIEI